MDQIKIGKLITKKRLEKKLTQSELGDLMGVTDKAVSKWERGINIPDIALIQPLSEILNISISELLSGEENPKEETKTVIDGIKFYNRKFKNKALLFVIPIIIMLIALLGVYFINTYNQCKVYSITSSNPDYKIHGYIIFNPNENILVLDNITYQGELLGTSDEPYIKNISILLKVKDDIIENIEMTDVNGRLSTILNSKSLYFEDYDNEKMKKLKKADKKDIYLELEIYDNDEQVNKIKIDLEFNEKFINNQLFYQKKHK